MRKENWKEICDAWKKYCDASLALEKALGRTALGTGEFAEALVCSSMEAEQCGPSQSGFDLVLDGGSKVQVKSRKIERSEWGTKKIEFGAFSSIESFEICAVVIFDKTGMVIRAGKINRDKLPLKKKRTKDGEKDVLYVNEDFFQLKDVVDITDSLNELIARGLSA